MTASARPGPLLIITAVIFILLGLALLGGGAWLASLGGSWYYVVAGIGMLVAGALVWKGRRSAQLFLALLLFATLIWSVIEVKFDWWQLLPRLDIWFAAAVWLLLPFVDRRLAPPLSAGAKPRDAGKSALAAAVVLTAAVGVFSLFQDYHTLHGEVSAENMRPRRKAISHRAWRPTTGPRMAAPAMATATRRPRRSRRPTPRS